MAPWYRGPIGLGMLAIGVGLGCLVWLEARAWSRLAGLAEPLKRVVPTEFDPAFEIRGRIEGMNRALLQFQLSGEPAERDEFHRHSHDLARDLEGWPGSASATNPAPLQALRRSIEEYRTATAPLLERGLRGVRRDSATVVREQIETIAAPLQTNADALVRQRREELQSGVTELRGQLSRLQRDLAWSRTAMGGMTVILAGALGWTLVRRRSAAAPGPGSADERLERLASLGELAAGVAHEIRNPLTAIKFRLFSLRRSLPAEIGDNEDLTVVDHEIHRLDGIVKGFLEFGRPAEPRPAVFPVDRLLHGVRELLQSELESRAIHVDVKAGPGIELRADEKQLQQVLINLVQNAADAIEREGTVTLKVRTGAAAIGRRSRPVTIVDVIDTGKGIPPAAGNRVFDPFFSTKQGGNGLGLAIAARIVELHGGHLQYVTSPGGGTTFSLVLPRLSSHESPNPAH